MHVQQHDVLASEAFGHQMDGIAAVRAAVVTDSKDSRGAMFSPRLGSTLCAFDCTGTEACEDRRSHAAPLRGTGAAMAQTPPVRIGRVPVPDFSDVRQIAIVACIVGSSSNPSAH